jgi:hypothetical protein
VTLKNLDILSYFFRPHRNFLILSFIQVQKCFISKTTCYDRETYFLSHSFTEKGQRKKIKMIMTNFAQRLKLVTFFQTTKFFFFNINIIFRNISLMFVQSFRSYFSEEIFPWSLSEWLSAQLCICSKNTKTDHSNQNQKRK